MDLPLGLSSPQIFSFHYSYRDVSATVLQWLKVLVFFRAVQGTHWLLNALICGFQLSRLLEPHQCSGDPWISWKKTKSALCYSCLKRWSSGSFGFAEKPWGLFEMWTLWYESWEDMRISNRSLTSAAAMWTFQKTLSKMLLCLFQLSGVRELVTIIAAVNIHLWFLFTACCSTLKISIWNPACQTFWTHPMCNCMRI